MADNLATLIIKLVADHADLTTGVKEANKEVDGLATQAGKLDAAFAAMDADRQIVKLSDSAVGATTAFGSFHSGLSQVDRTLAQFGVNVTPQLAAINEMASAVGKTAGQLGLVATAGLTAAAALGGWQLGRTVSDLFDLDEKVGNLTAKLLGFGDVAAETAGAKMDVMARASRIAGVEITSYAEALRIVTEENKRFAESFQTPEAAMGRIRAEVAAAQREYRGLSDETRSQIESLLEWGKSATEVEKLLKLKAGTVQVLIDRSKMAADEMKKTAAATDALAVSLAKMYSDVANARGKAQMDEAAATLARAAENVAAEARMHQDAGMLIAKAYADTWDAVKGHSLSSLQETAREAQKQYAFVVARAEEFAPAVIEKFRQTAEAAQAAADTWGDSFVGALASVEQKVTETTASVSAAALTWGQAMSAVGAGRGTMTGTVQQADGPMVPYGYNGTYMNLGLSGRREMGGPVMAGERYLVGERGPELFVPGASGAIVPNAGGVTVNVNVGHFIGSDRSAARELARIVKDELVTSIGSRHKLGAS